MSKCRLCNLEDGHQKMVESLKGDTLDISITSYVAGLIEGIVAPDAVNKSFCTDHRLLVAAATLQVVAVLANKVAESATKDATKERDTEPELPKEGVN